MTEEPKKALTFSRGGRSELGGGHRIVPHAYEYVLGGRSALRKNDVTDR